MLASNKFERYRSAGSHMPIAWGQEAHPAAEPDIGVYQPLITQKAIMDQARFLKAMSSW